MKSHFKIGQYVKIINGAPQCIGRHAQVIDTCETNSSIDREDQCFLDIDEGLFPWYEDELEVYQEFDKIKYYKLGQKVRLAGNIEWYLDNVRLFFRWTGIVVETERNDRYIIDVDGTWLRVAWDMLEAVDE